MLPKGHGYEKRYPRIKWWSPPYYKTALLSFSGMKKDTRERREESPENAGIKNDTRECRDECPKRNVGIKKDTRE